MNTISFKRLPPNTRYLAENLIVGAGQGLSGLRKLKKEEGVNLVIDVRKKKFFQSLIEEGICKFLKIKRIAIPTTLVAKTPDYDTFEKAAKAIRENQAGKTFIHCKHGKRRSVLASAIYLIRQGVIKSKEDFDRFLAENDFFNTQKSIFSKYFHFQNSTRTKLEHMEKIKTNFKNFYFNN